MYFTRRKLRSLLDRCALALVLAYLVVSLMAVCRSGGVQDDLRYERGEAEVALTGRNALQLQFEGEMFRGIQGVIMKAVESTSRYRTF